MNLRQSTRKQAKIKLALQGCAGSGKTYSSILLAQGLTQHDLSKVAIIDTEHGSSDLYAHLGNFNVLTLEAPYSPENYIQAIDICYKAGMEVIIIDSISHCWEHLLDFHSKLTGNTFTNWSKVTPRQKSFVEKILTTPVHIICTMRTKQDYILNQKNGKYVPEKVGLKAIQRDGLDYEFTVVFNLNSKNQATCSKDRTGLFLNKPEAILKPSTGQKILSWCESTLTAQDLSKRIEKCVSMKELIGIYTTYPRFREPLKEQFEKKKALLGGMMNSSRGSILNSTSTRV
mgnify:FL=1